MTEKPIFEVILGNPCNPNHHYKIWANGKVEGFANGDLPVLVINRIPQLQSTDPVAARLWSDHYARELEATAKCIEDGKKGNYIHDSLWSFFFAFARFAFRRLRERAGALFGFGRYANTLSAMASSAFL